MLNLATKFILIILISASTGTFCYSQIELDSLTELPSPLVECSGLIELNGHFITHNDSGDGPYLYELNTLTGSVIRQITNNNAQHNDWEDITHDDEYIYISDSGNNAGTRTNLRIYKILIDDFFNSANDQVDAETIHFAYADQVDFSGAETAHNFDAEALISLGDSLYIFTKNRGDFRTNIYPVSKTPGNYLLEKTDSFNSEGLITGATYIADSSKVVLIGYSIGNAFIIELEGVETGQFSQASIHRLNIDMQGSFQMESIAWKQGNDYLVATEGNALGGAVLYCLRVDINSSLEGDLSPYSIQYYPNPCTNTLFIEGPLGIQTSIYNSAGQLMLQSVDKNVDVSMLKNGIYWLLFKAKYGKTRKPYPLIITRL